MTEAKHTPTTAERLDWMLAQWEKPERKGVMLPGTQMTCDTAAEAVRAVIAEAKSSGPIAWESRPYEGSEWRPTAEPPSDETRRWMEHRRIAGAAPDAIREFAAAQSPYKPSTLAHKLFVNAVCSVAKAWVEERAAPGDGVPGTVLVPKTALDWLFGEGPDEEGHWFGDGNFPTKDAYWWRNPFRAMLSTAASTGKETP